MTDLVGRDDDDITTWVRDVTPARVFVGRTGSSYSTATLLELRGDHAAARDAVSAELDLERPGMRELVQRFAPLVVRTLATSPRQYLRRPDLGRRLSPVARDRLRDEGTHGADVQVVIGDGLSATAVHTQVPALLPLLMTGCAAAGLTTGRPVVVHQARVGIMNEIGDILAPAVVVLLIGERPGLATAESLSAYLAYRPHPGHTDADRNLLSNIHATGTPTSEAATRILTLIQTLIRTAQSGITVKEQPHLATPPTPD
jgi:ethanolamine ammonia-lyase small subunit